MRNQINYANQIHFILCSSALCSLSQVRKPWYHNHFSLYRTTFMCFMFKDIKATFVTASPSNPFRFLKASERKLSKIAAQFFTWIQVNVHTKAALPGRRLNRHRYITRPTAYLLNLKSKHGTVKIHKSIS